MKPLSLEAQFLMSIPGEAATKSLPRKAHNAADLLKALRPLPFNRAYDLLRLITRTLVEKEETAKAVELLKELAALLVSDDGEVATAADGDLYIATLQVLTAAYIEAGNSDEALVVSATLLTFMAQDAKRKDEPFLEVLAAMLYDIAYIHNERGQYKQAERELEKSMKLFERLAKNSPERYGAAHILAQNVSTRVYRSRVKQVNMLAHNQVATASYLEMLNSGIEGAADRLIDSLAAEGRTLAQMGRYREAVQYFSRALKYLTKIEPEFSERQLRLSIDLGEALLNVKVSRDKGIHLLNTMLHKATKLNADDDHRRIVDILLNAKSRRLDILGIWHKVFPR